MIFIIAFAALLAAASLCAWRYGGAAERRVALAFMIAWAVSIVIEAPPEGRYQTVWWPILLVDVIIFGLLARWAHQYRRAWLIPAAALQAVLLIAHVIRLLDPLFWPLAYTVMIWGWPFLQLILLVIGSITMRPTQRPSSRAG
jgi:hypothetical protein